MPKDYASFFTSPKRKSSRSYSVKQTPVKCSYFSFRITGYNLIAMQSQIKERKEEAPESTLESILMRMLSGFLGNRCPVWVYDQLTNKLEDIASVVHAWETPLLFVYDKGHFYDFNAGQGAKKGFGVMHFGNLMFDVKMIGEDQMERLPQGKPIDVGQDGCFLDDMIEKIDSLRARAQSS